MGKVLKPVTTKRFKALCNFMIKSYLYAMTKKGKPVLSVVTRCQSVVTVTAGQEPKYDFKCPKHADHWPG